MYILSQLDKKTNTKLSARLGIPVKQAGDGVAMATVLVRKNALGGIDEPAAFISNPRKTIVIAGMNDDAGMTFAESAANAGVPESQILFIPLSIKALAGQISKLISEPDEDDDIINEVAWSEPAPVPVENARIKKIVIAGFRGGVGRSMIASSLADYYSFNSEKVAVVDLGSPPTLTRYFGIEQEPVGQKNGLDVFKSKLDIYVPHCSVSVYPNDALKKAIEELKIQYRRVIVDLSSEPRTDHIEAINPDSTILVIDYDMVLSLPPNGAQGLLVYNKAVPEVSEEIVSGILGSEMVVINMDIEGCIAALVSGKPAYHTS